MRRASKSPCLRSLLSPAGDCLQGSAECCPAFRKTCKGWLFMVPAPFSLVSFKGSLTPQVSPKLDSLLSPQRSQHFPFPRNSCLPVSTCQRPSHPALPVRSPNPQGDSFFLHPSSSFMPAMLTRGVFWAGELFC